jgi:hypothetical protein
MRSKGSRQGAGALILATVFGTPGLEDGSILTQIGCFTPNHELLDSPRSAALAPAVTSPRRNLATLFLDAEDYQDKNDRCGNEPHLPNLLGIAVIEECQNRKTDQDNNLCNFRKRH